jgi:hypothetical protein
MINQSMKAGLSRMIMDYKVPYTQSGLITSLIVRSRTKLSLRSITLMCTIAYIEFHFLCYIIRLIYTNFALDLAVVEHTLSMCRFFAYQWVVRIAIFKLFSAPCGISSSNLPFMKTSKKLHSEIDLHLRVYYIDYI